MKYVYVGNQYQGDEFRKSIIRDYHLKKWLEAIIMSEQPYLAEGLAIKNSDKELETLLRFCKFFTAVLRDETPESLAADEWSQEFESKHHNLVCIYLNFIRNIYKK